MEWSASESFEWRCLRCYFDGLSHASFEWFRNNSENKRVFYNKEHEKLLLVLLHSSSEDEYLIQKAKELGITSRLLKPIKSEELFDTLRKTIIDSKEIQTIEIENQKKFHKIFETISHFNC